MNLLGQNYHIQKHMRKLQLEKNNKQKPGVQERFFGKSIGDYM